MSRASILRTGILYLTGSTRMDMGAVPLDGPATHFAFLAFVAAAFAKAGAMPLHAWIPDCAAGLWDSPPGAVGRSFPGLSWVTNPADSHRLQTSTGSPFLTRITGMKNRLT